MISNELSFEETRDSSSCVSGYGVSMNPHQHLTDSVVQPWPYRQAFMKQSGSDPCGALPFSINLADNSLVHIFPSVKQGDKPERKAYICDQCGKAFGDAKARKTHAEAVHDNLTFQCHCGKVYKYRPGLLRHKKSCILSTQTARHNPCGDGN